jgi:hypothetical protein
MSTSESFPRADLPSEWPDASFRELVTMCTSPALMGLGIVPAPGQDQASVDLPLARHFIDLLALLDEKTGDRLDATDQEALDQSLHELRMAFVQVQQSEESETQPDTPGSDTGPDTAEGQIPDNRPASGDEAAADPNEGG